MQAFQLNVKSSLLIRQDDLNKIAEPLIDFSMMFHVKTKVG